MSKRHASVARDRVDWQGEDVTSRSRAFIRLAASPVSWGIDFADHPDNPPWSQVLDEIAASGCTWTELGPIGYLPEAPQEVRRALAERSLRVAGSWLVQPLSDPEAGVGLLKEANRTCEVIAAAGGSFLIVIDSVREERNRTAGRGDEARRLSDDEWQAFAERIAQIVDVARGHSLRPVFHPHTATCVEFPDEIERLLAEFCADELNLCLDTGHAAFSGTDPIALYERIAPRVRYLHLKDVDGVVLERVKSQRMGFWEAIKLGVFCPLGRGVVDFGALRNRLDSASFDGWATVEQDRDPAGEATALTDLRTSVKFLDSLGFHQVEARQ